MMPGVSFEAISREIEDCYDYNELARLVRTRMNTRLDLIAAQGRFGDVVFELLSWAERNGREAELVRVAAQGKPGHAGMQRIYRQYGMAIPVSAHHAGKAAPRAPKDVTESGLEELIKPHTGFVDFNKWRERLTQVEGQVCRVTIGGHSAGTGFLVGPDAILTNYHVLRTVIVGETSPTEVHCEFDYKVLKTGARSLTPASLHSTDWLIDKSPPTAGEDEGDADRDEPTLEQLDYALVRLAKPLGDNARRWVRVPLAAPSLRSPMPLLIPQHPDGKPLKLAADTEAINEEAGLWLNGNKTRIRYATNTEAGASGSPCFDFNWNLIALHHFGDAGYGGAAGFNQGVPIEAIRGRLGRDPKLAAALGD
jgi:hypothetical protein